MRHCTCICIAVVQSLSYVWPFVTLWTTTRQASLALIISWSLRKLTSIESVMPLSYLIILSAFFLLFAYYYLYIKFLFILILIILLNFRAIWNKYGYSSYWVRKLRLVGGDR